MPLHIATYCFPLRDTLADGDGSMPDLGDGRLSAPSTLTVRDPLVWVMASCVRPEHDERIITKSVGTQVLVEANGTCTPMARYTSVPNVVDQEKSNLLWVRHFAECRTSLAVCTKLIDALGFRKATLHALSMHIDAPNQDGGVIF